MANTIVAGNGTNNGLAVTSDNTGALNILTGSGSGTTAISIDSSQNVTIAGNATITGTLTATGGGTIKSATAQASTSGTSIDFTSIPSGVKRITVMFSGVSTSGTSVPQIQLGTGSTTYTTSGYLGASSQLSNAVSSANYTTGFGFLLANSTNVIHGSVCITNISGNVWIASGVFGLSSAATTVTVTGNISLAAALTAVRITTVNGTDTFDAGSINIFYE